jgi:hypothetical protein
MRLQVPIAFLLLCAVTVQAQPQRWGSVASIERLKPGTRITVESTASTRAVDMDEQCRLISVDATSLTCSAEDNPRVRLVFPMGQVEAIYQVKRKLPGAGLVIGTVVFGLFIGGLAATWAPGILIGFFGGIVALAVESGQAADRGWRAIWGIPPPPPALPGRLVLVYHR